MKLDVKRRIRTSVVFLENLKKCERTEDKFAVGALPCRVNIKAEDGVLQEPDQASNVTLRYLRVITTFHIDSSMNSINGNENLHEAPRQSVGPEATNVVQLGPQ